MSEILPLAGIKILDLSAGYPGAFGTWILGDLGAEVTNIEAPPGPRTRQVKTTKRESLYQITNRNKRSITLNLKSEKARHIFYRLAEESDVIVEGFRPRVVKRLGVDYPTISKINPRIIYCSMSGYGQDGPYSNLPGHDINYLSIGGALNLIGEKNGQPVIPLNLVADYSGAALYATVGILTALIARNKTGKGQHIDIAYTDGVVSLLATFAEIYFRDNIIFKRGETAIGGGYPYYNTYETKDGKFITIGCMEPWLWENLCREIGREDFIPYYREPEHYFTSPKDEKWAEITFELKQIFSTKTRDEWFDILSKQDVPAGKVYSLDEVFTDPQVLHRKMIIEVDHPEEGKIKQVGIAIKLSDTPGKVRRLPPTVGEHTEEILTEIGYTQQTIDELRQEGAIS